jgi:heme exporter protein A
MIEVQHLTKSFGDRPVLRGLDLHVAQGERMALVGPNGAGKTTLLRILSGLCKPYSGDVHIAGLDLASADREIRRHIGFLTHQPLLYRDLSAEENLYFFGRMYDVQNLSGRVDYLLHEFRLTFHRHDLVRTYSRGMRRRLDVARVLLHDPPVLLLDEPYAGLDLQATEMLDEQVQQSSHGFRTVLLTTHQLEQGQRIIDTAASLIGGVITYRSGPSEQDGVKWDLSQFQEEYARQLSNRDNETLVR